MKEERMRTQILTLLAVALLAGGCGGDDDEDAVGEATTALTDTAGAQETAEEVLTEAEEALDEALTLDFEEQNGSGIGGTVKLEPTSEGQLEVEIELTGSGSGPHPAHIHRGSCADLDPNPAFPLEDVVDGRSKTTVDVTTADLVADEYAVNIHESPANANTYVACADVRNQ
jgi:Cu/Zn superoxide dismutase